jgi:cell division septation protein DedD
MVNGARKLGMPAFIAPGNSEKLYRVLSGPYDDSAAYEHARTMFLAMGLEAFPRRYTEQEAKSAAALPAHSGAR